MPKYRVELSDGRTFEVESDAPPSEADVIAALPPESPKTPAEEQPDRTWTDTAVDALPLLGGLAGGMIGGAGGTVAGMGVGGVPGAVGGSALGGAAGESAKQLINRVRGKAAPATPMDAAAGIAGQAATQAAGELGGRALAGTLRMVGRGAYRAGLLPILQHSGKYGDIVKTGVENAVPVSAKGQLKATRMVQAAKSAKDAAVSAADDTAMVPTEAVLRDVGQQMSASGKAQRLIGKVDPAQKVADRFSRIRQAAGPGMKPTQVEQFKSTLDDQLGGAYDKLRKRMPLSPTEQMDMGLSQSASRAQEQVVPGYKAMNKATMDASGLQRAIARRLMGGQANQGLENALTAAALPMAGPAALAPRVMMLPQVASTLGIGLHKAGSQPAIYSAPLKAALAAWLAEQGQ